MTASTAFHYEDRANRSFHDYYSSRQPGDLFGTGTLSGPMGGEAAALIEMTKGGKHPVVLQNGETRTWLEDGDSVTLRGWCEKPGSARIGFGTCMGTVLPTV